MILDNKKALRAETHQGGFTQYKAGGLLLCSYCLLYTTSPIISKVEGGCL